MARYRGRHRAPSTTGRRIASTAVAGAVAGAPLLFAAPVAHAAPDSTWDRVAHCESGGRWDINTGNGYQGGLQFSPSTWRAFGGAAFAASADRASRTQQVAVAERVLAAQGWGAWPVCSRQAGATGDAPTQRVAAAAKPAPAVAKKAPVVAKRAPVVAKAAPVKAALVKVAPAEVAPAKVAPAEVAPAKVAPAKTPETRVDAARVALEAAITSAPPATGAPYVVRAGDTLSEIAQQRNVAGGWNALAERNALADPDLILIGQTLTL